MKYIITYSIIFIVLLQGCKKEDSCPTLPASPSLLGYNFLVDSPVVKMPYFNPANPNEFLFIIEEFPISKLYTYNLNTGLKNKIFEGSILFPPKWSRKGWILLSLSDANIWKIKSNGDSLTQLTFSGQNYHCEWNYNGTQFIFGNSSIGTSLIANEDGVVLDTLRQSVFSSCLSWQNPRYLIATLQSQSIVRIDSSFNTTNTIASIEDSDENGVFLCSACDNLIWCSHGKMYSTDINSLKTSTLHSACLTTYIWPSSNGSKILVQRIQHKYLGDNLVETTNKLVQMNMDGNDEKEIQIN